MKRNRNKLGFISLQCIIAQQSDNERLQTCSPPPILQPGYVHWFSYNDQIQAVGDFNSVSPFLILNDLKLNNNT